jgi:hypothetical protein
MHFQVGINLCHIVIAHFTGTGWVIGTLTFPCDKIENLFITLNLRPRSQFLATQIIKGRLADNFA